MKKFNVKRLLSLIVLSLAVAAYSFAQETYSFSFPNVTPGSKKGLVNINIGIDLGTYSDKYVIENLTKENVVVKQFGGGRENLANPVDLLPNSNTFFTKDGGYFITPWPVEGDWGAIDICINDIKEKEKNGYYYEITDLDGGKTCKITVYKAN